MVQEHKRVTGLSGNEIYCLNKLGLCRRDSYASATAWSRSGSPAASGRGFRL